MDYPAIYAEYQLEGHTQVLGDWGFGMQRRCDCPEFLEVQPNTPRPLCRHVKIAMLGLADEQK